MAKTSKRTFIPTSEAMHELKCSRWYLHSRIKSGTFEQGKHFINVSDGMRPTYKFCLQEIKALYGY